jgi:hypothetical protein
MVFVLTPGGWAASCACSAVKTPAVVGSSNPPRISATRSGPPTSRPRIEAVWREAKRRRTPWGLQAGSSNRATHPIWYPATRESSFAYFGPDGRRILLRFQRFAEGALRGESLAGQRAPEAVNSDDLGVLCTGAHRQCVVSTLARPGIELAPSLQEMLCRYGLMRPDVGASTAVPASSRVGRVGAAVAPSSARLDLVGGLVLRFEPTTC